MSIFQQILVLVFYIAAGCLYRYGKYRGGRHGGMFSFIQLQEGNELQNEERVRHRWLLSLLAYWLIPLFCILINVLLTEQSDHMFFKLLVGIVWVLFVVTPSLWITIHCAYKKRGTAWLLFTLVTLILVELLDIARGRYLVPELPVYLLVPVFVVAMGSQMWFWINCLELHKINSEHEHKKLQLLRAKYDQEADGFY